MPGKGLEDANQEFVVEGARRTFPSAEKFPLAPSTPPTPLKTRASEAGKRSARHRQSRPHRSEGLQATRLRSGTKEEGTRERTAPAQESGSSERQQQGQNYRPMHEEPLPQAARSVMPCPCRPVVRGCRHSCEREREQRKGRAGTLFIFPNQRYPYHRTGTGMAVTCRAGAPLLFSPDFAPRTQKGPLAGALVSFSLIRPEPDTVIGTTRRFQPWRELPSWLRAGGSVR